MSITDMPFISSTRIRACKKVEIELKSSFDPYGKVTSIYKLLRKGLLLINQSLTALNDLLHIFIKEFNTVLIQFIQNHSLNTIQTTFWTLIRVSPSYNNIAKEVAKAHDIDQIQSYSIRAEVLLP